MAVETDAGITGWGVAFAYVSPRTNYTAVEEMIRWTTPVKEFMRTAAEDNGIATFDSGGEASIPVAVAVTLQPTEKTLTDTEIEAAALGKRLAEDVKPILVEASNAYVQLLAQAIKDSAARLASLTAPKEER